MNFDNETLSTIINLISNNTIKQPIKLERTLLKRNMPDNVSIEILSKRWTIQTTNQLIVL